MEYMFSWDTMVYLLGLAGMWGSIQARIRALEQKVEKHNSLVERLYRVENQSEIDHERIEKLEALRQRGEDG